MATNYPYTPNIPLATNKPSVDQPNMKINTNSINSIIGTDHLTFGTATGNQIDGMHTIVRQPTGAGTQNLTRSGAGAVYTNTPANITTINQFIAGTYTPDTTGPTTDTQLFSLSSNNIISQLTGSLLTNTATSDGWAWVGGILLQWGFVIPSTSHKYATIAFKDRIPGAIPFPNNIFTIIPTIFYTASVNPVLNLNANVGIARPFDKTQFSYTYTTGDPSNIGFYWLAIGN